MPKVVIRHDSLDDRGLEFSASDQLITVTGWVRYRPDGPMTGEWFAAYAAQVLAPTLRPGDINNLPAHKTMAAPEAIEVTGARMLFLPPYSPNFNPMDTPSKLKAFLRKAAARTVPEL